MPRVASQGSTRILTDNEVITGGTYEINRRINSPALRTFQATGTTTAGAGAATVVVQASNVDSAVDADWLTLGTITLTLGTTSTGDGFASSAGWTYFRGKITAISGTGAVVNLYMGY